MAAEGAAACSCGTVCLQGARFCHSCGGPAPPPGGPAACRRCGTKQVPGAAFCHGCGAAAASPGSSTLQNTPPQPPAQPPPPAADPPARRRSDPAPSSARPYRPFGRQVPWWERSVPWAKDSAGAAAQRSADLQSRHESRITVPWLLHAGLPQDSSVAASEEVRAFANFICATAGERLTRNAMRASVQTLALREWPEATVKVIGGWATGLASFDSDLDLVVEAAGVDLLFTLRDAVSAIGVEATLLSVPGGSALSFSAAAFATAVGQHAPAPPGCPEAGSGGGGGFAVILRSGPPGSHARAAALAVNGMFARRKQLRPAAVVLRHVLRHFDAPNGGLGGHTVALMVLAYAAQHESQQGDCADAGSVLRGFIRFFADFDFASRAICPAGGDPFPLRPAQHAASALCIIDPADPSRNAAAHTTAPRLRQLVATLQYTKMLIGRYDFDPRGLPLLPNLIPAKKLVPRCEWLRARAGTEVTKELAVAVAKGIADFLEDPGNASAKEELLQLATWDTLQSVVRDARVLSKVTAASGTAQNPTSAEQVSRALGSYSGDPEVRHEHLRAIQATVDPEPVLAEVLAFFQDPAAAEEKQRLMQAALACGAWVGVGDPDAAPPAPDEVGEQRAARLKVFEDILAAVAARPGSVIAAFRNCLPLLTEVMDRYYSDPRTQGMVQRLTVAAVTRDVALAVARDAADFLENPANAAVKERLMQAALHHSSEKFLETHNLLLEAMAESAEPGSRLARLRGNIPEIVNIIDSFHGDPEIDEQRARAARAAVTRDVTKVIAREISDALVQEEAHDPPEQTAAAPQVRRQAVWRTMESRLSAVMFLAAQPNTSLAAFKDAVGPGGFEQLLEGVLAFKDEPEVQELRSRAAAACAPPGTPQAVASAAVVQPPSLVPEEDFAAACGDFTPAGSVRAGRLAATVRLEGVALSTLRAALIDDPAQNLLRAHHAVRGDEVVTFGPWFTVGDPPRMEREVSYMARIQGLPPVPCAEKQRAWQEGSVLSLQRRAGVARTGVHTDTMADCTAVHGGIEVRCAVVATGAAVGDAASPLIRRSEAIAAAAARGFCDFLAQYRWGHA
eukprot:TRINITY_DN201_c0_g1_i3.p1 TRINITY_DN201_c0_g1~~TRINITY_DN201_c0_g1_i3.p1  ORF type:complete len:1104 (+),score=384.21 TRINITY_DN201_c0_g1_i3:79-3312(+)